MSSMSQVPCLVPYENHLYFFLFSCLYIMHIIIIIFIIIIIIIIIIITFSSSSSSSMIIIVINIDAQVAS